MSPDEEYDQGDVANRIREAQKVIEKMRLKLKRNAQNQASGEIFVMGRFDRGVDRPRATCNVNGSMEIIVRKEFWFSMENRKKQRRY
ncbi:MULTISPECIES: hypothetical protein [Rhodococcus]|uniref:Uncharacterized protein n=1 Tax=Rhodococcus oxybenzonivorans TaxID=1990687 RepID=A0AAE4UY91_9NOCA|nr:MULTISPECIES: hypothetical protein [Rhodococcus]MDV7241680.1 hypothetical protein [Rhodococcus oxybenzonivorans]MDV7264709.1 hypothetical protein [Rhodococcus oxybenzonivorans]MDV7273786.1 hypothetical protein [Rhodococcus oxybenzonivorans]MDV7333962.1 hypothetical protein [Rhodococcus oxybenzonivorans]MDV7343381.1 hypothetical protein [Rhodococcus oxybenzonivorans]